MSSGQDNSFNPIHTESVGLTEHLIGEESRTTNRRQLSSSGGLTSQQADELLKKWRNNFQYEPLPSVRGEMLCYVLGVVPITAVIVCILAAIVQNYVVLTIALIELILTVYHQYRLIRVKRTSQQVGIC